MQDITDDMMTNYISNFREVIFTVAPCILVLSSLFIYPTDAQLDCSKSVSQFTLKLPFLYIT